MHRTRLVVALGVVVLLVGAGVAAYAVLSGGRYDHALVRHGDSRGAPNRYVDLPQGRAQLAIGSPDSHRVVVQWRDPDGHGWTAPQTVWRASSRLSVVDSTVRYGGGTVAVHEELTPDDSGEDDGDDVVAGIVCRDLRCVARRVDDLGPPQVTPDGRTVLLGEDRSGADVWRADGPGARAIRAERWTGHPPSTYDVRSTTPALLAPDGTLRVVSAAATTSGTCAFALSVGGRRTTALREAGVVRERLRGSPRSQCSAYLDTISADWVAVHPDDHRAPDFWFVRRGGAWTTTRSDPSGAVVLDRGDGCCSTGTASFVHWDDVSVASPDGGHHLLLQTHLLGEDRWRAPVRVPGAPAGYACDTIPGDVQPLGRSAAALTLRCGRAGRTAYVVAVSQDLLHWRSRLVPGGTEPQVLDGTLVLGRTTWSPSDGFGTR